MAKEVFGIDAGVLKEVKSIFKETNIEEIEIEEPEKFYIRISREKPEAAVAMSAMPVMHQAVPAPTAGAPVQASPAPAGEVCIKTGSAYDDETKYYKVKSPVIGTYYDSSSPGANPFVKVGDTVSPDTTVCIIEAMKVMNEIKADAKGRIVEVLKADGDSVQSGEDIFIIEKA